MLELVAYVHGIRSQLESMAPWVAPLLRRHAYSQLHAFVATTVAHVGKGSYRVDPGILARSRGPAGGAEAAAGPGAHGEGGGGGGSSGGKGAGGMALSKMATLLRRGRGGVGRFASGER